MSAAKFFMVGGCVRDELMGLSSNDIDFAVEADSFESLKAELISEGFEIFVETPEFLTIRAHFPTNPKSRFNTPETKGLSGDFVMCRKDGFSSDGRRPDFVEPGTLFDDLARRDFTMNAIAKDILTGEIFDPHNGQDDIKDGLIRFVGDPMERIREDGLRVLRAFRFQVTKFPFECEVATEDALMTDESAEMLFAVSDNRVRDELHKMFTCDSMAAMELMAALPFKHKRAIFRTNKIKLLPTLGRKVPQ